MAKKWRKAMIIVTLVETIADSAPCAKSCLQHFFDWEIWWARNLFLFRKMTTIGIRALISNVSGSISCELQSPNNRVVKVNSRSIPVVQ